MVSKQKSVLQNVACVLLSIIISYFLQHMYLSAVTADWCRCSPQSDFSSQVFFLFYSSQQEQTQSDSVNNKGMQRQFCFVSDESKIIYISTMVKKRKKSTSRDVFELCYNIIQYQYVLRLQKLCYYSECVSDHSYSNVL